MSRKITTNLNTLPVISYRWMKVNDLPLEIPVRETPSPYAKEYITHFPQSMDSGVSLEKIAFASFSAESETLRRKDLSYGVSKEMVELSENNHNSGIHLSLPRGSVVSEPITIAYTLSESSPEVIDYNIIYAGPGSKATLIFDYSSEDSSPSLHCGAMRVHADENAELTIVKVQRINEVSRHLDSVVTISSPHARVNYVQIELGGTHSVTNYSNYLEEAAEVSIDSVYFGDREQLIDLSYLMEHRGRRSISKIQTKGALKDHAVKTFRGTIDFKTGASGSDGSEQEYVILFDKTVTSNAIPLLLCGEDDVQGEHAASAGKVDPDQLFYMMSRGYSRDTAMKMIVEASFRPVLDLIPSETLKETIHNEIHRRLVHE